MKCLNYMYFVKKQCRISDLSKLFIRNQLHDAYTGGLMPAYFNLSLIVKMTTKGLFVSRIIDVPYA